MHILLLNLPVTLRNAYHHPQRSITRKCTNFFSCMTTSAVPPRRAQKFSTSHKARMKLERDSPAGIWRLCKEGPPKLVSLRSAKIPLMPYLLKTEPSEYSFAHL